MITGIVIPADLDQPVRLEQLDKADLGVYRRLVGGPLEAVELERPAASLYLNEQGKLEELPINPRATLIVWVHNSRYRGHDTIVGDVFIVGPVDEEGDDLTVPDELVALFTKPGRFKFDVNTLSDDEDTWTSDGMVYEGVFDAYAASVELALRWTAVDEVRVVREP